MIAIKRILVATDFSEPSVVALSRFLMGSVAERVVRSAPCPVLTVRAHERDLVNERQYDTEITYPAERITE